LGIRGEAKRRLHERLRVFRSSQSRTELSAWRKTTSDWYLGGTFQIPVFSKNETRARLGRGEKGRRGIGASSLRVVGVKRRTSKRGEKGGGKGAFQQDPLKYVALPQEGFG